MTTEQMFFGAATGTTVLAVTTVDAGSVTVVQAAGELDMDTAGQFGRHVTGAVAAHAPALLIVDLQELRFLGAAGVNALLACMDVVGRAGGRMSLRRPSRPVLLALRATHTLDLFDVEGDPGRR